MILEYKIQFLDYWHIGSGISSGAFVDALILKDKNQMPFVPGKTIKGILRNIAYEDKCDKLSKCFGESDDLISKTIFKNAVLNEKEYNYIVKNSLQKYLYDYLSFTRINKSGIADDDTLRDIEVCIPLVLEGEIIIEDDECIECIKNGLRKIKHIGLMRNRGLGRCNITLKDKK